MRLALAQINSVVGDIDGNAARIVDWLAGGPRRERRPRPLPGARGHRLSARGPAPPPRVRARRAAGGREIAHATHGVTALVGAPHLDADLYNACFVLAARRGAVHLPQALPAELRRLRRRPLLRAGRRPLSAALRRRAHRPDDLRGHLAARAAGDRPRARRRAADREHLRVAVPRRQGPRARGDAARAGTRQLVLRRALQRGRRAGRADLRRALGRARRRGRGARARRRVRGGAARRRRRSRRGRRPPAARRAPARARARAGHGRAGRRSSFAPPRDQPEPSAGADRRLSSTSSSRCGSRSSSGCTTTSRRTASGTS